MKEKILTALIITIFAGVEAKADIYDSTRGLTGYDPAQIDNTNFTQGKIYKRTIQEQERKDSAIIEEEVRQKMELLNADNVSFKLKKINITGNTKFPTYVLMRLADFKIGSEVTINDLIMSANDITDYYQSRGYLSTVSYLPPQKVKDGVIEIRVLEGRYGDIEVNAENGNVRLTLIKDI